MTDSDIQYIGNWSSDQVVSNSSANVSAVILTSEDDSKLRLTFSRTQTPVVFIGRSPRNEPKDHEGRATYNNLLMSRSHAKITFCSAHSDSVSLVDTNSHHGTWVNRKAEEFKLTSDKPFSLQDGDKIRFGKAVVKDGVSHMPLVVSVKLLFSSATPPSARFMSCSVTPEDGIRPQSCARNRFRLSLSSSESESSFPDVESPSVVPDNVETTTRVGTSSSLFGLTSPQSSPGPSTVNAVEPLPPMDPGVQEDNGSGDSANFPLPQSVVNSQTDNSTPPWRRFSHSPWFDAVTNSLFRHVPDILPRPSLRTDYLFGSRTSSGSQIHPIFSNHGHHQGPPSTAHGNGSEHPLHEPSHHGYHPHHPHTHDHHRHHHHHPQPHGPHHHQHSDQHNAGFTDKSYKDLGEDINALKEELQSLKTIVSRLDETSATKEHVRTLLDSLEKKTSEISSEVAEKCVGGRTAAFFTAQRSMEHNVAELKQKVSGLESCNTALENTLDGLRHDIAKIKKLDEQLEKVDRMYNIANGQLEEYRTTITDFRTEMDSVWMDVDGLGKDLRRLDERVPHNPIDESALESRLKDYIKVELGRLVNIDFNSFRPILGKRKRSGEDEDEDEDVPLTNHVDAHVQTIGDAPSTVAPPFSNADRTVTVARVSPESASRPTKRLKTLASFIVPGLIGAIGACAGLAYL